ncbi:unnamed protein product [Aureobasidium mustum]|uniref:F-box domain-containing protein n=1 Tax=Aureobasidium mustum TaxID=2773714 RepID=A0A9N8JXZ4_9PEZI|nr:unnamed protein product [Aureobasidium mustum]
MDTLPLELKQRVCSYLTPKDLKSLRLASKAYASAACRYFLPRIFLHNHPNSFEEIQDITDHPDLKHSNRMFNSIALAFQRCPRLKHLVVESGGRSLVESGMSKSMLRLYKDDFPSSATHTQTHIWPYWDHMTFNIWNLLKPIRDANGALHSLVLLDSQLVCHPDRAFPATSIFESLKHLRESDSPVNFLTSLVASAPNLESFGTIGLHGRQRASPLSSLTDGPPLTKLRACSLSHLVDEDHIVRFLLRQSNTLQRLRMHDSIYYGRTNWSSLAAQLKGKLRNLRRIEFSFLEMGPSTYDASTQSWRWNYMKEQDILQNHEHELETGPMETEEGLWEDYEKRFFPKKFES